MWWGASVGLCQMLRHFLLCQRKGKLGGTNRGRQKGVLQGLVMCKTVPNSILVWMSPVPNQPSLSCLLPSHWMFSQLCLTLYAMCTYVERSSWDPYVLEQNLVRAGGLFMSFSIFLKPHVCVGGLCLCLCVCGMCSTSLLVEPASRKVATWSGGSPGLGQLERANTFSIP